MTLNSHNLTADKLLNIYKLYNVFYKLTFSGKVNFTYLGIEKNLILFAFVFSLDLQVLCVLLFLTAL